MCRNKSMWDVEHGGCYFFDTVSPQVDVGNGVPASRCREYLELFGALNIAGKLVFFLVKILIFLTPGRKIWQHLHPRELNLSHSSPKELNS